MDDLIGAHAAPGGGVDDGAYGSVEIGAPCGPEPAGGLATGGGWAKFALAGVDSGDIGVVEEDEEVLAQSAIALHSRCPCRFVGASAMTVSSAPETGRPRLRRVS